MNFPARSALRLYSVMPCASTRIVPPSFALDAVLTSAVEPSLLAGALAGWLVDPELLLELLELLPQPPSTAAAANTGMRNFVDVGTVLLLCREPVLAGGSLWLFKLRDAASDGFLPSQLQSGTREPSSQPVDAAREVATIAR
jgi:hypothetical protein